MPTKDPISSESLDSDGDGVNDQDELSTGSDPMIADVPIFSGNFFEEMEVKISFEGDTVILAEAPTFVVCEISYAEPGVKGDTATNTLKPATLDSGATVSVPLFCNEGDLVKVDTRTATYVERVKK